MMMDAPFKLKNKNGRAMIYMNHRSAIKTIKFGRLPLGKPILNGRVTHSLADGIVLPQEFYLSYAFRIISLQQLSIVFFRFF